MEESRDGPFAVRNSSERLRWGMLVLTPLDICLTRVTRSLCTESSNRLPLPLGTPLVNRVLVKWGTEVSLGEVKVTFVAERVTVFLALGVEVVAE